MKVICVKICEHSKKNFCVNKENLLFTLLFLYKALKMSALYARETKETKKQCSLTLYIAFYYFIITSIKYFKVIYQFYFQILYKLLFTLFIYI